jgi:hypothetical protein
MFVPVSCTNCGKPFQVPESALGKPAACPWCQAVVTALPVGASEPTNPPVHTGGSPEGKPEVHTSGSPEEPLSLDDEPESRAKRPVAVPVAPPARPSAPPRAPLSIKMVVVGLVIVAVIAGLTIFALGYGSGRVPSSAWFEFTPPDGSCTVLMPGTPKEEDVAPHPAASVTGGKRYVTRNWYSRTSAWVGWGELDPKFQASLAKDKDRDKLFAAAALEAERNREASRLEGTVTKEMEVRINDAWGIEVHMDTPRGQVVEWLLLVSDGPRPRLYVYGFQSRSLTPDSAAVRRMFTSFKVNN